MQQESSPQKKNKKPIIILVIILLIMGGAGMYYWIHSSHYARTDDAQLDGDIYAVNASVTAYLKEIKFQDHQYVHQGDTLLVFDTIQLKAKVEKARSALAQAQAKLSVSDLKALVRQQNAQASRQDMLSMNEDIVAAKARFDKAKKDFNRDKQLLAIEAITPAQYEADSTNLTQAKANYEQSIYQQKSGKSSLSSLLSQAKAAHQQTSTTMALVSQRETELIAAQDQLNHAIVRAPSDGIVSKRAVNAGEYVTTGQALCAIVDESNLWVTANFKETELKNIEPGQSVNISVDAYPNLDLEGKVQSFGGATGAKFSLIPPDNATGNFIKVTQRFPVRIMVNNFFTESDKPNGRNNNGKSPVLFPGLSVGVKVKIK